VNDFISIDFETANNKRVSACAIGLARVSNGEIVESRHYLIKPVGGHLSFLTRIHGITEMDTWNKPDFGELYPEIKQIFDFPLVAHSLFDKQVLNALSEHFGLNLKFKYIDTCSLAKKALPHLAKHKLNLLVDYFELPEFKHHDAKEDAVACARIYLKLQALK
jgi:DNA polymerase III subunit epsilon